MAVAFDDRIVMGPESNAQTKTLSLNWRQYASALSLSPELLPGESSSSKLPLYNSISNRYN
jgi:hypothetical protein